MAARRRLTTKQFKKGIDELKEEVRLLLAEHTQPFPKDAKAQKKRIERASKSLEFFGLTYFPHYLEKPNSELHRYLCERSQKLIDHAEETGEGDKESDAAPRGNAKSTWETLILPLWCTTFKKRRFILITSDTKDQADDFVSFIQFELEMNERLAQDYPDICIPGRTWRRGTLITINGVKIRSAGAGQRMRGMRHGAMRPDLVIGDDLENEEGVESPEQRKKLENWFFKTLMKIGKKYTVFIVVGTILHYDSLLNRLLKRPGWKGRKFQSVLKWSESPLWEEWEKIFIDITVGKEKAERLADEFFERNREEMLAGTKVLWPEEEDYYYLMKMRISDGPAYFDSEKQNEPISPDECPFKPEDFHFWEEGDTHLADAPRYGALDPSMGKKSRKNDPYALMIGDYAQDILWLDIADIDRKDPDSVLEDIFTYHKKKSLSAFAGEIIQFQEYYIRRIERICHERGETLNVVTLKPNVDKGLRIMKLQPWIRNGWIRFRKHHRTLLDQLKYWPKADHDDGPDALEMLVSLIELNPVFRFEYRSVRPRPMKGGEKPGKKFSMRPPDRTAKRAGSADKFKEF